MSRGSHTRTGGALSAALLGLSVAVSACSCPPSSPPASAPAEAEARPTQDEPAQAPASDDLEAEATPQPAPAIEPPELAARLAERQDERDAMVDEQLASREIVSPAVLAAMRAVPRHLFVPAEHQREAYDDHPLPIGYDVTISQPYIVALMTQLADVEPGERVLEIGTGSGYQAAVLDQLGAEVYSIEIIEPLAESARARLRELGYARVRVRAGDGYRGWPERAPFEAIVLTAAPPAVPQPLLDQLAVGGRLVAPVGTFVQSLLVITRTKGGFKRREEGLVRFVPMTGEAERP